MPPRALPPLGCGALPGVARGWTAPCPLDSLDSMDSRLGGFYMVFTLFLHGFDNVWVVSWFLHGFYMVLTWFLRRFYSVFTLFLHGFYTVFTWF